MTVSVHPYRRLRPFSRWRQGVNEGFRSEEILAGVRFRGLGQADRVFSAGSCFAGNVTRYLDAAGITYVRTERRPHALAELKDGLGYDVFSARFGNIYTARQFVQLLVRC